MFIGKTSNGVIKMSKSMSLSEQLKFISIGILLFVLYLVAYFLDRPLRG
jgi:hypothetical protein